VLAAMAGPVSAQGLAADDDGSYGGFQKHGRAARAGHGVQTISGPDALIREGRQAYRFEVRSGDCGGADCREDRERVEMTERGGTRPGSAQWYAWSFRLAADFPYIRPTNTTLGQFKQEPQGCEVAGIGIENQRLFFYNKLCANKDGGEARYMIDKPFMSLAQARGRWVDIMVHSNWSAGSDGFLEFYVNGRRVAAHRGPVSYNMRDKITFRFGVYRSFVSRYGRPVPTQVAYFDNVRSGPTRESVELPR